jgi:hypothetical protein
MTYQGMDDMMIYAPNDFADALDRIDKRAGDFAVFFGASILPTLKSEAQSVIDRIVTAKNLKKPS